MAREIKGVHQRNLTILPWGSLVAASRILCVRSFRLASRDVAIEALSSQNGAVDRTPDEAVVGGRGVLALLMAENSSRRLSGFD